MTMDQLIVIGILPAALVVLAGMLVLYASPANIARQRLLLYLLAVGVLLALAIFIAMLLTPEMDNRPSAQVSAFLSPSLIGVLALILINLKSLREMNLRARGAVLLLCLTLSVLLALTGSEIYVGGLLVLAGALVLAIVWVLARRSGALVGILSVVAVAGMTLLNNDTLSTAIAPESPLLRVLIGISSYVLPGVVIPLAAVLISTGLRQLSQAHQTEQVATVPRPSLAVTAYVRMGLAVLLLGYFAYTIVWLSIWDQTSDGIGGVWFSMQAALISVGAGMLMVTATTGKRRVAGALFAIAVPLLMAQANRWGWDVSYHELTEARAARIQGALESYYARNGRYPAMLDELVPRDLWYIESPVILRGEGWCYQGGPDYYRLAAIYREYFSTPLSIHMYASAGAPPAIGWACDDRLAVLKARYDAWMENPVTVMPTPVPQPTSVVNVPRMAVQPVVVSPDLSLGTISPDGKYLLFGLPERTGSERRMSLHFLDVTTGQTCPANLSFPLEPEVLEPGLRARHAWLPDGRMLFIAKPGEVVTLMPCKTEIEKLSGRYTEPFSRVGSSAPGGRYVLVRGATAYWVLDGATLQAARTDVSPNDYENHWDRFAFSPSGERLAIARLNGRDSTGGSTLYLLNARIGSVAQSLPLDDASDQSAPMVEWLSEDQLLLHGQGALKIVDFRPSPPTVSNALKDIFNLDIAYSNDISSMSSFVDSGGKGFHLAVRVNHPRDKALYLYHSEVGSFEVLHPEGHALLIFPDGQWADMQQWEDSPTYRDEYELIWVDAPEKPVSHFAVQGHTPRNYPMLFAKYLPATSQMAFGSSQGASLNALPGGETIAFWELGDGISTYVLAPTNGKALIAIIDRVGLYYLPLPLSSP